MPHHDSFEGLARFYDPIMRHVNYDRWFLIVNAVGNLLPRPFLHLDAACGTGVLLKRLRAQHWRCIGLDLSKAMLSTHRGNGRSVCADLRAIPFLQRFDYVTCLFDSLNFLLSEHDLYRGVAELATALRPNGLLYFDVVTERMVLDHFAGQEWTEKNDGFSSAWSCEYDRNTRTIETHIRINSGAAHVLRERVYPLEQVLDAVERAGCEVLGCCDAQTWRRPNRKTVRADIVAVKGSAKPYRRGFRRVQKLIQEALR